MIGGGDTGSDCIGTSIRQGAASVTNFELMPMPPEQEDKPLTWPYWPLKLRTSSSHEEGAERDFAVATKAFHGKDGKVESLTACHVEWVKDAKGAMAMKEVPGTEFTIPAQLVLLAMGYVHPGARGPRSTQLGVAKDARGNVKATTDGAGLLCDLGRRRSSPRATCAAASRSWSGRSARAASARARSTPSSWEARTCRAERVARGVARSSCSSSSLALRSRVAGARVARAGAASSSIRSRRIGRAAAPAAAGSSRTCASPRATARALAGVLVQPAGRRAAPLVIYFGGNAEEVTRTPPAARRPTASAPCCCVNYRGYGASGGTPGETAMVADAHRALRLGGARAPTSTRRASRCTARSLGTGVAVQVAAARPARCVVLTSPFASARDVARDDLPVAAGRRCSCAIRSIPARTRRGSKVPALFLVGERRHAHPAAPLEAPRGPGAGRSSAWRSQGFGHNDLDVHPALRRRDPRFLDALPVE